MNLLHTTLATLLIVGATAAQAYDPKATIADLDARLAKIGTPKIEGTEDVAGKTVPAIYFGARKINNNFDVVDAVRRAHNATATVFVKDGEEVTPPAPDAAFGGVDSPAGAVRREVRRAALARRRRTTSCLHRGRRSDRVR